MLSANELIQILVIIKNLKSKIDYVSKRLLFMVILSMQFLQLKLKLMQCFYINFSVTIL